MNKLKYIRDFVNSDFTFIIDNDILSSLIYSLEPSEACDLFELDFNQVFLLRRYILKKINQDIAEKYQDCHKELIDNFIECFDTLPLREKERCAFSLIYLYDNLPNDIKDYILKKFLNSKYKKIRTKAYKKLFKEWNNAFYEIIEKCWIKYREIDCAKIIIENFPVEYLMTNLKELTKILDAFSVTKLFKKIGDFDQSKIELLKDIDEIGYVYILTKYNKQISKKDALKIYKANIKDERIGLLIWCFGQMKLWEVLVKINEMRREESLIKQLM